MIHLKCVIGMLIASTIMMQQDVKWEVIPNKITARVYDITAQAAIKGNWYVYFTKHKETITSVPVLMEIDSNPNVLVFGPQKQTGAVEISSGYRVVIIRRIILIKDTVTVIGGNIQWQIPKENNRPPPVKFSVTVGK